MTLTREQLRERIDNMERLESVLSAIDDVSGAEFNQGDTATLCIAERGPEERPIAFVHAIPSELVLIGLRAMQKHLESMVEYYRVTA